MANPTIKTSASSPTQALHLTVQPFGHITVLTKDLENIDSTITADSKSFGMGHRGHYSAPLLGQRSILTVDGHEWKSRRAMTRPILGVVWMTSVVSRCILVKLVEAFDGAGMEAENDCPVIISEPCPQEYLSI